MEPSSASTSTHAATVQPAGKRPSATPEVRLTPARRRGRRCHREGPTLPGDAG
jgi:hypothetical protein